MSVNTAAPSSAGGILRAVMCRTVTGLEGKLPGRIAIQYEQPNETLDRCLRPIGRPLAADVLTAGNRVEKLWEQLH